MKIIALVAVVGILLLQAADAIPLGSVGGSLTIGFAYLAAALAVGVHEAWTAGRGLLGWIANLFLSFFGAMAGANLGGFALVIGLSAIFPAGRSIAATGGLVTCLALAGGMACALLGAWAALRLVNRWR